MRTRLGPRLRPLHLPRFVDDPGRHTSEILRLGCATLRLPGLGPSSQRPIVQLIDAPAEHDLADVGAAARASELAPLPVPIDVFALLLQLVLEHQSVPFVGLGHGLLDLIRYVLVNGSSAPSRRRNRLLGVAELAVALGPGRVGAAAARPPTSTLALVGVRPGAVGLVELLGPQVLVWSRFVVPSLLPCDGI